jgi:hypothetical protein
MEIDCGYCRWILYTIIPQTLTSFSMSKDNPYHEMFSWKNIHSQSYQITNSFQVTTLTGNITGKHFIQ